MGSVMVRQSDNQQRGSYLRACLRLCLLFMAGVAFWVLLAAGSAGPGMLATPVAKAVPAYQHSAAESCTSCHHRGSVASCSTCHEQQGLDANLANQSCTSCHSNKQAPDRTCWSCHKPGEAQPEPTAAACQLCHTVTPHLAATATCTTSACHGGAVTPHHDGQEQNLPTDCTDCHTNEQHGQQDCTTCHSATKHPDYPKMPETCTQCHAADTFATGQDCTECHAGGPGTPGTAGKTDNDIHDSALPDGPIGPAGCTTCHPGRTEHAGKVACTTCHDSAEAFHHGNASSPGYPDCRSCHADKPKPAAGRSCQTCHKGAQHQAQPQVGSCSSCHGTGRARHAGKVACTTCHDSAEAFHHGNASSPGYPDCRSCHADKPKPAAGRSCQTCHKGAQHQAHPQVGSCRSCHGTGRARNAGKVASTTCHDSAEPFHHGNAASPGYPDCRSCHADKPKPAAGRSCQTCHKGAQHQAQPQVGSCSSCHGTGRARHAGKVACTTCRDSAEAFHHGNASSPGYPDCRSCHADKPKPAAGRSCQTCHKGAQHQAQPQVGSCSSCQGTGRARHAGKVACTTCHDSAEAFHHGNASSPGYPDCRSCHADKPKPAAGRSCQTCHKGAQHQAQPQVGSCS